MKGPFQQIVEILRLLYFYYLDEFFYLKECIHFPET